MFDEEDTIAEEVKRLNTPEVTVEEFSQCASIIKALVATDKVYFRIWSPNKVNIVAKKDALEPELKKAKMSEDRYAYIVRKEISPLLSASLSGAEEAYIKFKEPEPDEMPEEVNKDEYLEQLRSTIRDKFKVIREKIITKEIHKAYQFKRYHSNKVLQKIRWQINVTRNSSKDAKDDITGSGNIPFASIQLALHNPSQFQDVYPFPPWVRFGSLEPEYVTCDCDINDIEFLIEELIKVKESIKEIEE